MTLVDVSALNFSPEAEAIGKRLENERIQSLYHFTCIENLPGIAEAQAICSKQELESMGKWPPPIPGGNPQSHSLDRSQGNWNKVGLLFNPHTPMAWKRKSEIHMCFFEVSVEVACWEGVNFSNANAASPLHKRERGIAGLNLINFENVRSDPRPGDWDWKHSSQAEVLVPGRIPLSAVEKVIFVSEASRAEAMRLWNNRSSPPFEVNLEPFVSVPGNTFTGFSYISDAFLSESTGSTTRTRFNRNTCHAVVGNVTLEALTGTTGIARWAPTAQEERKEFRTTGSYEWTPRVPIHQLQNGICSLELFLGEVRWASIPFEVIG